MEEKGFTFRLSYPRVGQPELTQKTSAVKQSVQGTIIAGKD